MAFWLVNPLWYNDIMANRRTISEIFAEVSPETTVIPGGKRYGKGKKKAEKPSEVVSPPGVPYTQKVMTGDDYEKAEGDPCPICGNKTMQLFPYGFLGNRKACKNCIERRTYLLENRRKILGARRNRR